MRQETQLRAAAANTTTNATHDDIIVYTEEELEAIRKVRQDLIGNKQIDPNRIGLKTLALTTIVAKLRIKEASEKYVKYSNAVKECGIPSLHDDTVLSANPASTSMDTNHYLLHERFLNQYALCGRDHAGRSITWIRAPKEPHEEAMETAVVRAAIMYHTVIHADPISLRGTVLPLLLIRPTNPPNNDDPRTTRSYKKLASNAPLHPQTVLIAGASYPLRIIINTLITITSVFFKKKVLEEIQLNLCPPKKP